MEGEKIVLWPLITLYFTLFGLCPRCLRDLHKRSSFTKQQWGFFCTELFKVGSSEKEQKTPPVFYVDIT